MSSTHSCVIAPHLKDALLPHAQDGNSKYGRMFPHLHHPPTHENLLLAISRIGSPMDIAARAEHEKDSDNARIAAGFTFFGQFIAHDITADRSLLSHHARLKELHNFRVPRLDLECVYGAGPTGEPFLYDLNDADKLLVGINAIGQPDDVPRNQQGRALVADPRNDVHLFLSQFHLAMLKFHNRIVDYVRTRSGKSDAVFDEARKLTRWYYQWIVVHEFLPLTVGDALVADILQHGPRFYPRGQQLFIPVEFADAAYRFGHSQIRSSYTLNVRGEQGQVFPDYAGTSPVPPERVIDWAYFFHLAQQHSPQASKQIDTKLAHSLIDLPESVVGVTETQEEHSLAYRDLERGRALDLPSGEAIAEEMGVPALTTEEIGLAPFGWRGETPLWYYILKEAEVRHNGEYLGEVGGRIVAEVLLGLLQADPTSYLNAPDAWTPSLPSTEHGQFVITDLLRFAGAAA